MSGYLADWPVSIEQVNEALAEYDGTQYLIPRDAMQTVVEAARRFVAGWETCPTCEGKGGYNVQSTRGPIETDYLVCPDCVDGMIPSLDSVERGAKVMHRRWTEESANPDDPDDTYYPELWDEMEDEDRDWYLSMSAAVLLASRREEQ